MSNARTYPEQVRKDAKAAGDYIREHGWIQGEYFSGYLEGACCALGACRKGCDRDHDETPLARAFINEVGGPAHIWNDAPGRTKEEVLEVFDRIARSTPEGEQR